MAIKITIEQIDIEQAIKDHIGSMMEIKPDAQLDIDLSATRGSAGFTATILIRNADEVAREGTAIIANRSTSQLEPVAETAANGKIDGRTKAAKSLNMPKATEKTGTITQTSDLADLPVEVVTETSDEIQVELPLASIEEVEEVVEVEEVEVEVVDQEVNEQSDQIGEAAPRASLFGSLTKPKN
jgi:hypothetical protein